MKYEDPNMELMKWEIYDVICTSPGTDSNLDDFETGDDDGGFSR